jgi:cytidine deaminase
MKHSIREFCELDTPIVMFDRDGMFVVMRLEQVCVLPWERGGEYS